VADLNTSFVQKIFHITEWERKPNIKHHSQADDLRAGFKVPEWGVFCHTARLRNRTPRLKLVFLKVPLRVKLVQEDRVRERVSHSTRDKMSYSIRAYPKRKRYGWRMDYVIKNDHVPFHVS